jgi:hypothetical protein
MAGVYVCVVELSRFAPFDQSRGLDSRCPGKQQNPRHRFGERGFSAFPECAGVLCAPTAVRWERRRPFSWRVVFCRAPVGRAPPAARARQSPA